MNRDIHIAAFYGELVNLKFLINNGRSLNCKNNEGNTPLILAAYGPKKKNKLKVMHLLLENEALINDINNMGNSVMHAAVYSVAKGTINKRCIGWLLKMGADFRRSNYNGKTVLQIALQYKLNYVTDLILNCNYDDALMEGDKECEELIGGTAIVFTSFRKCMRVSRLKQNRNLVVSDVWNSDEESYSKGINVINYNFPYMCS